MDGFASGDECCGEEGIAGEGMVAAGEVALVEGRDLRFGGIFAVGLER